MLLLLSSASAFAAPFAFEGSFAAADFGPAGLDRCFGICFAFAFDVVIGGDADASDGGTVGAAMG